MNNGKWDNTQILDSDWVSHSLNTQVSRPTSWVNIPSGYGFQFWIDLVIENDYREDVPYASGSGGQYIIIWRAMDMVIVFTAGNYNRSDIKNNPDRAFVNYIVPSVKEMQPYLSK